MMRKNILLLLALLSCAAAHGQQVKLKISNPTPRQRQEVVSADARQVYRMLGLHRGDPVRVFTPRGVQTDWQITSDSLLLVYVTVRPHAQTEYVVRPGKPEPMTTWTTGALYPQRLDDMAWENDLIAYRAYGPALQRTGEQSFGIDLWVKNTPSPVVADRYRMEEEGNRLKKEVKGDSLMLAHSYHVDHGHGYDPYSVGATLGCGAPALMLGDSLVMPYCFKEYKILDNGPLRFTVDLTYGTVTYGSDKVTEHRLISLDRGTHFNRISVRYDGLSRPASVAAGFVVHQDDHSELIVTADRALYADPTDQRDNNQCQVYVGGYFPEAQQVRYIPLGTPRSGAVGHAVGITTLSDGKPYTYYTGAAWSGYDVRTFTQWQTVVDETIDNLRNPLSVTCIYEPKR